jgi:hypothetical protein
MEASSKRRYQARDSHAAKKGAAPLQRRKIIALAAPVVFCLALVGEANARDYKLGCVGADCVIVDDTGRISFFSVGGKTVVEGADQLKAPETARIRPPLNISCGTAATGATCVITDADGYVWVGPSRAGGAYGEPVARIPVPGPN